MDSVVGLVYRRSLSDSLEVYNSCFFNIKGFQFPSGQYDDDEQDNLYEQ